MIVADGVGYGWMGMKDSGEWDRVCKIGMLMRMTLYVDRHGCGRMMIVQTDCDDFTVIGGVWRCWHLITRKRGLCGCCG